MTVVFTPVVPTAARPVATEATMARYAALLAEYTALDASWGAFTRREAAQQWLVNKTDATWVKNADRLEATVARRRAEALWVPVEGGTTYWMDNSVEVTERHAVTGETRRRMTVAPHGDAC